ncbi:ribosome biogenesis protein SLX9 homolog isoform X1 [Eublepharis macularius]|uniref:Ribosome biogenesis protein SLX9 homolog isoform X1 n=1 Tax=Eublepharis macularius TaxID=481883 RepID=A0AA97JVH6_EUBMA|nr:ribosome biogenesis protein SLX9 homolog isoform X1 [Eublepharis macularius]
MVGKVVKRPRLHLVAPKLPKGFGQAAAEEGVVTARASPDKVQAFLPSNIFAGVKIDPKTLVKKLDADSRSIVSAVKGEEEKVPLSKKEKMKLHKERWLQKIEDIKLAKKLQKAEMKRKATPVVGDMNPLMEALPELSDLVTISKFCKQPKIQVKKMVTNFTQMKSAQKRKVLEDDVAQFHKMLSNPLYKASPLTVIGEHLSKRLKQEKEGEPL